MKKIIKKVLAMLLVVCMALPMFTMSVSAEVVTGTAGKVEWTYDTDKTVLTYVGKASGNVSVPAPTDAIKAFSADVTEVEIKNNNDSKFISFGAEAFKTANSTYWTALKKFTIPNTLISFGGSQTFKGASSLEEIVVEGNAYIPGAADLSGFTRTGTYVTTFDTNKHRTFEGTKIKIFILPGGFYSDSKPIQASYSGSCSFGNAITTIMGPHNDTYLKKFATEDNNWKYVPYGKIGEGTAWTYDTETATVTIYGNGTSSTLTALSDDDAEFLKDATKVVIRADITAIEANALEDLAALTDVEFLGNEPETTGNPFGKKTGITIYPVPGATGFDDFYGYTVSYPEVKGTFVASGSGTEKDGTWELDLKTKTLHIWSENSAKSLDLPNLIAAESFKTFAKGDYSKYVTTVKFNKKGDESVFVKTINGNNNGFGQLATLGLTEIEKIYFFGSTLQRMTKMFNGLDKLTTFGNDETEEQTGTVNLVPYLMDGGDATGSFSGQTGIKKVILPENNTWGNSYSTNPGNHWANIPGGYFKDMTGLCEVVLNANTTSVNKAGKEAYFLGTCMIGANAFEGCTSLKSLTIPAGAPATAIFRRSNGANEHDVKLFDENTFAGSSIETVYIWNPDAAVVAEYNIPNVAKVVCANDAVAEIFEDTTADVSCILTGVGVAVRYEKYNGLRNIYSFNNVANANMGGYELVEYGAMIVSSDKLDESELTIDPSTLKANVTGAVKKAIWSNKAWAGNVLSHNENGETQFALTLTKYTDNWDSDVYSRAYAVYKDGNENYFVAYAVPYSDPKSKGISLYDAMVYAGQNGNLVENDKGEEIVCDNVAVWNVLATGKVENGDINAGEGIEAMVINGKTDADAKVLVVRMANGDLADDTAIKAAKDAAVAAGYTALNDTVIALDFLA